MSHSRVSSLLPTNLSVLLDILSAFIPLGQSFLVLRVPSHFEKTLERLEECRGKSITYFPKTSLTVNLLIEFELCVYMLSIIKQDWDGGDSEVLTEELGKREFRG